MIKFKYRYCKVQMLRYVSGDLSDSARRRVARYIEECEDCYREYRRQRDFAQQLERSLPSFGRPDAQRLEKLWGAVERDLQAPSSRRAWFRDFGLRTSMQFNYGLLITAIAIALLLPLMVGYHASIVAADVPAAPRSPLVFGELSRENADRQFVISTSQASSRRTGPQLQNTPSPGI